ncbi:MAG: hypothetical protein N4A46_14300 [Schleiferiaceae bacterium]|jgi:hypothetical protein|nr:hypothetical protein [Schleiferiaceae bacterium]
MRKFLALTAFISFALFSKGQNMASELELYQSVFSSEKKMMIVEYMQLSDDQNAAFWDVYNAYEASRAELGKQRFQMLQDYANGYESMTDESAGELLKRANSFAGKQDKLKSKYSKKMVKAIGAKKALQWMQFESYLDRVIGLYIMESLPFVGEYN